MTSTPRRYTELRSVQLRSIVTYFNSITTVCTYTYCHPFHVFRRYVKRRWNWKKMKLFCQWPTSTRYTSTTGISGQSSQRNTHICTLQAFHLHVLLLESIFKKHMHNICNWEGSAVRQQMIVKALHRLTDAVHVLS